MCMYVLMYMSQQSGCVSHRVYLCYHLVIIGQSIYMLDLAAKLDQTAEFICKLNWGNLTFPPPFGREALPEVRTDVM